MCSLEDDYTSEVSRKRISLAFQRCVRTELALKAKINIIIGLGRDYPPRPALLGIYD